MARTKIQGYVEQGGNTVTTAAFISSTKAQGSFPLATVTVYLTGTLTLATIYSNSGGTAKANPFAAGADGHFFFFIDDGTYDVQFSSNVNSPSFTTFSWSAITVGGGGIGYNVTSFGAVGDGVTDDTVAIQAAVDVVGAHTVLFPAGTFLVTNTITIDQDQVWIVGEGKFQTTIKFQPTSGGKPVFDFNSGTGIHLARNGITGFGFTSTNTTLKKIMVRITDCEEMEMSFLASVGGGWTGNTSVGIHTFGRHMLNLHDCTIFTQVPIQISQNPNVAALDADHFHFWNLYLGADGATNYQIEIDTGVVLTNTIIDGYQAWVKGMGGIRWANTAASASNNVLIADIRHEQTESATGYILDLGGTANINGLTIRNINGGAGGRGIKLRTANNATIDTYYYVGTGVALDVDSTTDELVLLNCFTGQGGASASLTGQTVMMATQVSGISSTAPTRPIAFYKSTSNGNVDILLNGTKYWTASGTLASSGQFNILGQTQAGTEKAFIVQVAAKNNATSAPEGGTVVVSGSTGGSAALVGGTTNFGVGNVVGKLTILWQNFSTVTLLNQLAASATVDYVITVTYI